MKGEILLKTTYVNATIVTMNEQNEVIENGYIIVENDQIIDVKSGEFASDFEVDEVIDMKGKWVLPGLVNTHTHVVMSLLRGIGDDMLLQPWLETRIWPLESQFTPQIAVASTELGLLEMVKSGTTSFSDMFNPIGVDRMQLWKRYQEAECELLFQELYLALERKKMKRKQLKKLRNM